MLSEQSKSNLLKAKSSLNEARKLIGNVKMNTRFSDFKNKKDGKNADKALVNAIDFIKKTNSQLDRVV